MKTEAPEPEGLEPTSLLAMHAQQNMEGLGSAVERMGSVKLVNVVGEVDHLPDSFVIFRQHLTGEEIHRYQYEPGRHFDEKLKPILDHYGDRVDAVEDGMNEMIGPSNRDQNRRMVDFALTTARLVRERCDEAIKTVMLNPGPGAFPLKWIEDFDPVFETSDQHGELIGLHPYTPAIGSRVWIDEWYPLPFMQIDEYARSKGWFPLYVGTEAGPIGGHLGGAR